MHPDPSESFHCSVNPGFKMLDILVPKILQDSSDIDFAERVAKMRINDESNGILVLNRS